MSENLFDQQELMVLDNTLYFYGATLTNDYYFSIDAVSDYVRTKVTKADVGLSDVDNTPDLGKPISTATQSALNAKQPLDSDLTAIAALTPSTNDFIQRVGGVWTNRGPADVKLSLFLNKSDVGLSNVDNTPDANKPVSTAQATAISVVNTLAQTGVDNAAAAQLTANQATVLAISAGTSASNAQSSADNALAVANTKQASDADLTAIAALTPADNDILQRKSGVWVNRTPTQFKSDLALSKTDVGLGNVDNTSDVNKPISAATQTALNAKQSTSEKGQADGYAPLDSTGKIPAAYIPAFAITETFVVNSQAEMLALSAADIGDIAIRADIDRVYILKVSGGYATLSNWALMPVPASSVLSVNGYTGVVTLAKSDIGLGNVDNTPDANKPISNATQAALDNKQPLDSDLTAIAAIAPANDDFIQRKAGVWVNRTIAQVKSDLALTKSDVGLSNVDNTSDVGKPVSTAQATAIGLKADKTLTFLTINNEAGLDNERALAVTANELKKTDNGANNTLVLGLANDLVMPGTVGFTPVTRTTAQRAAAPAGSIAYNSTIGQLERYIGGEWVPFGKVIQTVHGIIAVQSGTVQTPYSNAAPTITNGFQIWTASITPLLQSSNLIIIQSMFIDHGNNNRTMTLALFDDTTLIGCTAANLGTAGRPVQLGMTRTYTHNKTTAMTISARVGANGNGTTYVNQSAAANLGGVAQSAFIILEFKP